MITQENASSSDELTQSSNQLSILATNLKQAVGFFKLKELEKDEMEDVFLDQNKKRKKPKKLYRIRISKKGRE